MKRLLVLLALAGLISHAHGQTYPGQTTVLSFGAVCDGSTNDATAIQNAINSLPPSGGRVLFPAGRVCAVGATLNIGNGGVGTLSTTNGIFLDCDGIPNATSFFGTQTAPTGCKIVWTSVSNPAVITVKGPIQGWGIRNMYVECAAVAGVGLNVISGIGGDVRNTVWNGCTGQGILEQTVPQFSGNNTNNEHNRYENTLIILPNVANAQGIFLTGQATDATSDTHSELWTNTTIYVPGTATAFNPIVLQTADQVVFVRTMVFGGGAGCQAVQFNYSQHNAFPASNSFYNIDPGSGCTTKFVNSGTPGAATPNYIYGLAENNTATVPNLANLTAHGSHQMVFSPGGNTVNVQFNPIPVAIVSLPTCNASTLGSRGIVNNGQTTPGYLATVGTTGAVMAGVLCNGTNWVYD